MLPCIVNFFMALREDDSSDLLDPVARNTENMLPKDLAQLADLQDKDYRRSLSPELLRAKALKIEIALKGHLPDKTAEIAARAKTLIEAALARGQK